jgi:hypothetical protein
MTEQSTETTLLLNLLAQVGNMREDVATVIAGLAHVGEKQKEFATNIEAIEGRLATGSKRHEEFAATLADIEVKLGNFHPVTAVVAEIKEKFGPLVEAVATMKPEVQWLTEFKTRMAGVVLAASTIMGFATWAIWEGLKWLFTDAGKSLLAKIFH